jgi:hypothetical protein
MAFHRIIIAVLAIFLLSGCATTGSTTSGAEEAPRALDVAMKLRFEDVPVPSGFRIIIPESFTFQNEVLRVGILKYAGSATTDQVISFYKDQMPLYDWQLLNVLEHKNSIMNFDRQDQNCIIVIEPTGMRTYITITVAPKAGRASTYRPYETK